MNNMLLQIFLFLNIFLIGAFSTIALRHAYAHFRPQPKSNKSHSEDKTVRLPPEVRQQLLNLAQTNFQAVLDHSASQLQNDLKLTAEQLNKRLDKLGNQIINEETNHYRDSLEALRKQTETTISSGNTDIAIYQTELKAKLSKRQEELESELTKEITAEKQYLIEKLDIKLADAVTSFLIETLQHDVDLGAQSPYLINLLEEHKDEFIKGVDNED